MVNNVLDRRQRDEQMAAQLGLSQAQMAQAKTLAEAKQRAQADAEAMKESGRMSRAEMRQRGNADRIDLDRERLAMEGAKRDDPLFLELRKYEAQGDRAGVEAVLSEMERRGYTVGRDGTPVPPGADEAAEAPPLQGGPPGPPNVPTARFPDVESEGAPKSMPGAAMDEAGKKIAQATAGIPDAGSGKPGEAFDRVAPSTAAQFAELERMLGAGIAPPKKQSPMQPGTPGAAMDEAGRSIDQQMRSIPNTPSPVPSMPGFTIEGKGTKLRSSAGQTSDFNKRKVEEVFGGMLARAKDANEAEAVKRAMVVASGATGSMDLENAINKGMEAYRFEINRNYRRKPWTGGGKAGLSKADRLALSGVNDDLFGFYKEQKSSNDYKGVVQAENAAQQTRELLSAERPTADAAALGALVKSTEGGRPTDADREVYLRGQGAISRIKQRIAEATNDGTEVVMTPEFRADLQAISELNTNLATTRRRRLSENFKKSARGLASIRERYPDKKLFDEDVETLGNSMMQESGGPEATSPAAPAGGDGQAAKPTEQQRIERFKRMLRKP
jgi:hypothetical protein